MYKSGSSNLVACLLLLAATSFCRLHTATATCSPMFGQCGGKLWTGPTCCQPGSKCEVQTNNGVVNEYYSQCLPMHDSSTDCASPGQQCGGNGWTGPTCCTAGNVCVTTGGSVPACVPSDQSPPSSCSPKYGQCGGRLWQGPTCCEPGTTCQVQYDTSVPPKRNEYYSQCLPMGDSQPNIMPPPSVTYTSPPPDVVTTPPPVVTNASPPRHVGTMPPPVVTISSPPPHVVTTPPPPTIPTGSDAQTWADEVAAAISSDDVCGTNFINVLLAEPRLLTAGEYSQAFTGSLASDASGSIDCGSAGTVNFYGCLAGKAIFDAIGTSVASCSVSTQRSALAASATAKTSAAKPNRPAQTRSLLTSFRQLLQSQTCIGVCPICGPSSAWCNAERSAAVCTAVGQLISQLLNTLWTGPFEIGQDMITAAELNSLRQLTSQFAVNICKAVFVNGCDESEQPCSACKAQNPSQCGSFCCCASETGTTCPEIGTCPNAGFEGSTCCCPYCQIPKGRNCECVLDTETDDPTCV